MWPSWGWIINENINKNKKLSIEIQVSDEEIEEAFKMFDRDNSGTINHNEVKWENIDIHQDPRP